MSNIIALISNSPAFTALDEQRVIFDQRADETLELGKRPNATLSAFLDNLEKYIKEGDTLLLFSPESLDTAPSKMLKLVAHLFRLGAALEFAQPSCRFAASSPGHLLPAFVDVLIRHTKFTHGKNRQEAITKKKGRRSALSKHSHDEIQSAIDQQNGNITLAAQTLGVARSTLYLYLNKQNLAGRQ